MLVMFLEQDLTDLDVVAVTMLVHVSGARVADLDVVAVTMLVHVSGARVADLDVVALTILVMFLEREWLTLMLWL